MSNSMKIRPPGAELIHADGRTDRIDETHSRFSKFLEKSLKTSASSGNIAYTIKQSRRCLCNTLSHTDSKRSVIVTVHYTEL
jgi:hypothetical protein